MVEKVFHKPDLHSIIYGGEKIEFELNYTSSNRLTIDVHPDQRITVKGPQDKSIEEIKKRVENRAKWILKQVQYFENYQPIQPPRRFVSGETHYYLGRQYRLKIIKNNEKSVKLIGKYLTVSTPDKDDQRSIKSQVEQWYKDHARPIIQKHVDQCFEKVQRFDIEYPQIQIRLMKKRWGSFSKNRKIILNSELIKTPLYCIDYVITHELCHLKIPNHSREFYLLLTKCMPDWEQRKERLEMVQI